MPGLPLVAAFATEFHRARPRVWLAGRVTGAGRCGEALYVFAYEVRQTIGAYAAAMGGLDAMVFAGVIGENSAPLRSACCSRMGMLGVALDAERNERGHGDRVLSTEVSDVKVLALATNEELMVARRAFRALAARR